MTPGDRESIWLLSAMLQKALSLTPTKSVTVTEMEVEVFKSQSNRTAYGGFTMSQGSFPDPAMGRYWKVEWIDKNAPKRIKRAFDLE